MSLEDEEFSTVSDFDEFNLIATEAVLGASEMDLTLEVSFKIKDEVAAREIHQNVLIIDERNKIVIVCSSLREHVNVRQISKWLHDDAVTSERGFGLEEVFFIISTFLLNVCRVLLHVPNETAFLGIAWSADVQVVVDHNFFGCPGGVVFGL